MVDLERAKKYAVRGHLVSFAGTDNLFHRFCDKCKAMSILTMQYPVSA